MMSEQKKTRTRGPNLMPRRIWSPDEVSWLSKHLHLSKKEIAAHIGCTTGSVKTALRKYGLKLQSTGRFAPGAVPFYKGKKLPDHVRERIAHTWFRKGNVPHNTTYDGAITARPDQSGRMYFWIRVRQGEHKHLHRHLWEQAHGPVPAGYRVCFKDNNTANCVLENLELVSGKEAMARNSILRYPKDVQDAMRALGMLNQKLKRYGKEQDERHA